MQSMHLQRSGLNKTVFRLHLIIVIFIIFSFFRVKRLLFQVSHSQFKMCFLSKRYFIDQDWRSRIQGEKSVHTKHMIQQMYRCWPQTPMDVHYWPSFGSQHASISRFCFSVVFIEVNIMFMSSLHPQSCSLHHHDRLHTLISAVPGFK